MWTLRVAVAIGGIGVDANLRILQVIGSPEGSLLALFSSPLAPASRPGDSEASNRFRGVVGQSLNAWCCRIARGNVAAGCNSRGSSWRARCLTFYVERQLDLSSVAARLREISEMADRRDWGGGGDDPEESTQRMIERIWESLTDIRARMDQQAPVPPVAVPPGDGEAVPVAPVPPRVEVPFVAPVPPPPPVQ
ncbi:hypothetical protein Taro_021567 [Colocasia esculenta]|uniref:Uncharacterized protein n=1 Tax=Colocasia esculenta TaxID=4460 RepID=A0A843V2T5_COLES|nr:hypothetical protein [Colocasia esculenta]